MRLARSFFCGVLIGIVAASFAQQLGYSDAQILKMGRQKWIDTYSAKESSSTAAMVQAQSIFGQVLYRRNQPLVLRKPIAMQSTISALRRDLAAYRISAIELSMAFTGGGTMWSPVYAGAAADAEEVIYYLVSRQGTKPKARVASDLTKALARLKAIVEKKKAYLDDFKGSGYGFLMAKDCVSGMRNAADSLVALARKLPRTDSDAILGFCLHSIDLVMNEAVYAE